MATFLPDNLVQPNKYNQHRPSLQDRSGGGAGSRCGRFSVLSECRCAPPRHLAARAPVVSRETHITVAACRERRGSRRAIAQFLRNRSRPGGMVRRNGQDAGNRRHTVDAVKRGFGVALRPRREAMETGIPGSCSRCGVDLAPSGGDRRPESRNPALRAAPEPDSHAEYHCENVEKPSYINWKRLDSKSWFTCVGHGCSAPDCGR